MPAQSSPNRKKNSRPAEPEELRVLGVMTGTSCDGLDVSCVGFSPEGWRPLWTASSAYPKPLRERVLKAQAPGVKLTLREWLELHRDLGDWYADAVKKLLHGQRYLPHVIACHGQTVAHYPAPGGKGMTLQLGDPSRISQATGLSVISNFREGDIAAGGQGAPLVPLFHQLLAQALGAQGGIAIHNLGGISNLTYVGEDGRLLAFDTGPGNIWIDAAAEIASGGKHKFDRDGRMAARGRPDEKLLKEWIKHPYFRKKPPKSTGRDDFPVAMVKAAAKRVKGDDLVASATWLTAETIARAYEDFIIEAKLELTTVIVCGGGAKNPTLMGWLEDRMPGIQVTAIDNLGMSSQAIESQAFATFGYLALMGQPLGGNWTGARGYGPPAHVVPGENWDEVLSILHS